MKILLQVLVLSVSMVLFIFSGNIGAAALPVSLSYDQGLVSIESKTSVVSILKTLADEAEIEIYIAEKFRDYSNEHEFSRRPLGEVLAKLLKGYNYAVIYSDASLNPRGVYSYTELDRFYPVDQAGADVRYAPKTMGKRLSVAIQGSRNSGDSKGEGGMGENRSSRLSEDGTGGPDQTDRNDLETGSGTRTDSGNSIAYTTTDSGQSSSSVETSLTGTSDSTTSSTDSTDSANSVTLTTAETESDIENDQDLTSQKIAALEYQIEQLEEEIASGKADAFYEFWSSKKDSKYVYNHREDLATKQKQLAALRGN